MDTLFSLSGFLILAHYHFSFIVQITFIPAAIAAYFYAQHLKKQQAAPQAPLTTNEKIIASLLCIFNPLFSGPIMYYTLRKAFPQKAKTANFISFIVLGIAVLIGVLTTLSLGWIMRGM